MKEKKNKFLLQLYTLITVQSPLSSSQTAKYKRVGRCFRRHLSSQHRTSPDYRNITIKISNHESLSDLSQGLPLSQFASKCWLMMKDLRASFVQLSFPCSELFSIKETNIILLSFPPSLPTILSDSICFVSKGSLSHYVTLIFSVKQPHTASSLHNKKSVIRASNAHMNA